MTGWKETLPAVRAGTGSTGQAAYPLRNWTPCSRPPGIWPGQASLLPTRSKMAHRRQPRGPSREQPPASSNQELQHKKPERTQASPAANPPR